MNAEEKKTLKDRLAIAEKLEARIASVKELSGCLTSACKRDVTVTDSDSGRVVWHGDPSDIRGGLQLQLKSLEAELEQA